MTKTTYWAERKAKEIATFTLRGMSEIDAKRAQRQKYAVTEDMRRCAEIRAHNCAVSGCGVVCTFGQW